MIGSIRRSVCVPLFVAVSSISGKMDQPHVIGSSLQRLTKQKRSWRRSVNRDFLLSLMLMQQGSFSSVRCSFVLPVVHHDISRKRRARL